MWSDRDEYDSLEGFDTAQVCMNGHMINACVRRNPEFNQKCCDKCGAPTITNCEKCNSPVQGLRMNTSFLAPDPGRHIAPRGFCYECGAPYPWTKARLDAAKEFADMLEGLSDDEREKLKESLTDLVADTPRTALAATKWKFYLAKAGQFVADGFKEVMYDIAVEAAKRGIWGS